MPEDYNIRHQDYKINHADHLWLMGHRSACLWFTGFSGSGKSTLANKVEEELYKRGYKTYSLDGDNIRKGLSKDLSFDEKDRCENLRRAGEVAALMCDAGLVVLAAFVSPCSQDRKMVRSCISENFLEIFVDTPIKECEKRDVKGLYEKARRGEIPNFTGISAPFECPLSPDIHIETTKQTLEQSVLIILECILPKLKL